MIYRYIETSNKCCICEKAMISGAVQAAAGLADYEVIIDQMLRLVN